MHTKLWWLACVAVLLLAPRRSFAQLAPTGSHYAARSSDTGFTGADGAGGYSTSIPFDFPTARGGLPIPVQAATGGARYGALGVGWDVPLSFVYVDESFAHRRPTSRKRVSVSLMGRTTEMVQYGGEWLGRSATDLKLITDGATYTLFDGNGLTYVFTKPSALNGTGGPSASDGLWLLTYIDGPGGSRLFLGYDIQTGKANANDPADSVSINLAKVSYNRHPVDGCFKNDIELVYQTRAAGAPPRSLTVLGDRILARFVRLDAIDVKARTDCRTTPQVLRHYSFLYERPDADSGQDRLTKVTLTGRSVSGVPAPTVPVATYAYGSASSGPDGARVLSYASSGSWALPSGAYPAITQAAAGADAALSFSSPIGSAVEVAGTVQTLVDFTGDGRADLVFRDDKGASPTYKLKIARNDPSAAGGFAAPEFLDGVPTHLMDARSFKYARFKQPTDSLYNEENIWTQTIDVNGDGRLDIVDAASQAWIWVVYLNTPDSSVASGIKWERRAYNITKLYNHFHDEGWGSSLEGGFLPLSRRITGRRYVRETCWVKTNGQWVSAPQWVRAPLVPGTNFNIRECDQPKETYDLSSHGDELTFTEWSLADMNGDGYPDFTFNSSPIVFTGTVTILREPGSDKYSYGTETLTLAPRDASNQVLTAYNSSGVFIRETSPGDPFTNAVALFSSGCGVGMWRADEPTASQGSECGFADVNGDGIADRLTEFGYALLGTGMGFNTTRVALLGRSWLAQVSDHRAKCDLDGSDWALARTSQAIRDLTGDGIPDIARASGSGLSVTVGTGSGYSPSGLGSPANIAVTLSQVDERCDGRSSRTASGMFDVDGDGKADYVWLNSSQNGFGASSLTNSTSAVGAADAGRLISIGNGYGATTNITYRSAKSDTTTKHQVAAPEIVVDSEQTTGLAKTLYAYGNIDTYRRIQADRVPAPCRVDSVGGLTSFWTRDRNRRIRTGAIREHSIAERTLWPVLESRNHQRGDRDGGAVHRSVDDPPD